MIKENVFLFLCEKPNLGELFFWIQKQFAFSPFVLQQFESIRLFLVLFLKAVQVIVCAQLTLYWFPNINPYRFPLYGITRLILWLFKVTDKLPFKHHGMSLNFIVVSILIHQGQIFLEGFSFLSF